MDPPSSREAGRSAEPSLPSAAITHPGWPDQDPGSSGSSALYLAASRRRALRFVRAARRSAWRFPHPGHPSGVHAFHVLLANDADIAALRGAYDLTPADRVLALELALAAGLSPSLPVNSDGVTLLHLLASGGCSGRRWDAAAEMLEPAGRLVALAARMGADVEARDALHRASPLSWAAWFRSRAGVLAMLEVGANLDSVDGYGCSAEDLIVQRMGAEMPLEVGLCDDEGEVVPRGLEGRARAEWRARQARELRRGHAEWAEAPARQRAATAAILAAHACEAALGAGNTLPGPALHLVARLCMEFDLWAPVTLPFAR